MKVLLLFLCPLFLLSSYSFAQIDPVDKNGTALGGYDVVAYFESGKAVKGDKQISYVLNGVRYLFSSKENQKMFGSTPLKYLPAFDGYCALAVSYGKKISIDPQTFKITDGKLFLFYNGNSGGKKVNSLDTWNKNEPRLLEKADKLWPEVKKRKYRPEDGL
jgi:YHS domain-containing protein